MSSRYKKELVPSNHPSPVCMVTSMSLSEKHHHTEKQTHKAKLCNTCKFSNDLWLCQSCSREVFPFYDLDNDELLELIFNFTTVSASYPDVSLARAKEGGKETSGKKARRMLSVPFPWSLAAHHQSIASTLRKTKRLRRRLPLCHLLLFHWSRSTGAVLWNNIEESLEYLTLRKFK